MSNPTYINFFPGSTSDERSLSIDDTEAYGHEDIVGLVDSMIVGCTSSAPTEGARDAVRDGSLWGDLCAKHGDDMVRGTLEELDALLA